jgi:Bacterial pre-peptidase C-terminal domain/Matrixin/Peptidase M10 serralysin C terminal
MSDRAGNTLSTARLIDLAIAPAQSFSDNVGRIDPIDLYQLNLSTRSFLNLNLNQITADADLRLADQTGKVIAGSYQANTNTDSIALELLPGTYYIQVSPYQGDTDYRLDMAVTEFGALVATTPKSGQLAIDALLNAELTYWNTRATGGVITYSFYQETSGGYIGPERVSQLSEPVKASIRNILNNLETYINVDFVEVADRADSAGELRYMFSDGEGATGFYAYAYSPGEGIGGDVHLSDKWETGATGPFWAAPGSYGYTTLIHETLHALGLKHPNNYDNSITDVGPNLPANEDNKSNTVLSYNYVGAGSQTPLTYDIRALQYLYGSKPTATGNSVYEFVTPTTYRLDGTLRPAPSTTGYDNVQPSNQTIWDAGGTDTIDLSKLADLSQLTNSSQQYYLDLRPGGLFTLASVLATSYVDRTTNQTFTAPDYGTMIAYGTVIENVIGSKGNDRIIANTASNRFSGYGLTSGNDVVEGSDRFDILDLSGNLRSALNVTIAAQDLVIRFSNTSTVRLSNYFANGNQARIFIDGANYIYTAAGNWQAV